MNIPSKASLPTLLALASAIIAMASLAGWFTGMHVLTSFLAGSPVMVPLTAAMTLLASHALAAGGRAADASRSRLPAVLLMALAAVVLAAHGNAPLYPPAGPAAGQAGAWDLPSPLTALLFLATGASLLGLQPSAQVARFQWIALGQLLLALLTLASYLSRQTLLYQLLPGTGIAFPTAIALVLLPIGILAARPSDGIMAAVSGPAPAAAIARRLLSSAVALPVLLGVLVWLALHFDVVDSNTAIALLVWGIAALFIMVTWHGALQLGRAETARAQAEAALGAAMLSLREADAHKDRFLAVLAHELRNPLAPIRAAADLLRVPAGIDAVQQRRTGDIIARQVDHMGRLIEDLLDLSRVRQGLIGAQRAPVDLCAVVRDAIEQTRPLMTQHRHQLHAELPEDGPCLTGDHRRLVQAVANLLVNAARYTPPGGRIVLALRVAGGGPAALAEISVGDNGIGMDAALLARVFEPFVQGEGAGAAKSGLGIGLALVRSLVELHGGTVTAESAGPGAGSTFRIALPCTDGKPCPAPRGEASS